MIDISKTIKGKIVIFRKIDIILTTKLKSNKPTNTKVNTPYLNKY